MLAGRPHEAAGNGSPRWMTAAPRKRGHRTRPTGRLTRSIISNLRYFLSPAPPSPGGVTPSPEDVAALRERVRDLAPNLVPGNRGPPAGSWPG
jgi:hypothetical protein